MMLYCCRLASIAWLLPMTAAWAQIPAVEGPVRERAVLRSVEIREGSGEAAQPGQEYTAHYTGWLSSGTKFDSSVDRHEPIRFVQGRRQVIPGFDAGFEGMRVGGRRRLIIPYQLAYGEKGRGSIPPRAELTFDVELLGVRDMEAEVPSRGFLVALAEYEKKTLALAQAIPEEKLSWRPAPAERSVGQVLAHVALGNRLMIELVDGEGKPMAAEALRARVEKQGAEERAVRTKAELIAMLEGSFAFARKQAEPLRAAQLSREVTMWGERTTVQGLHTQLVGHAGEHLGQLTVYARMLGITPPWSGGAR